MIFTGSAAFTATHDANNNAPASRTQDARIPCLIMRSFGGLLLELLFGNRRSFAHDRRAVKDARMRRHCVRPRAMQRRAVVVHDEIADLPVMEIRELLLSREVEQLFQERTAF